MKTTFIFILLICVLSVPVCKAQGGIVDQTFGKAGIAVPFDEFSNANALFVLPDDKILVASGWGVRLLPDGQIDKGFGNNGKASVSMGFDGFSNTIAVQPDGKILFAGQVLAGIGNTDYAIVRLNSDGTPDISFNSIGNATFDFAGFHDRCYAVAIQPDGKILLAGSSSDDYSVIRLNSDGSLDLSFNGTGKVSTEVDGYNGEAHGVLLQADGKIILAGYVNTGTITSHDITLIRYKPNGIVDSSFGIYGFVTTDLFQTRESIKAATMLADGSILVAGLVETQNDNDFLLVKYKPDGTRDSSFGTYGYSVADIENGSDDISYAMTVQPDGRIILAGRTWPVTINSSLFSLARFTTDGILDTKFGSGGIVLGPEIKDSPVPDNWANAVALQSNGKIIAAGYAKMGTAFESKLALVRYHSDETAGITSPSKKNVQVIPNPATHTLFLHLANRAEKIPYQILNSAGQTILSGVLLQQDNTIDISNLSAGYYFLKLSDNKNFLSTQSFLKQ